MKIPTSRPWLLTDRQAGVMRCLQVLARANLTPLNAMDASDGSVLQTLERHGLVTHEKRHSWHRQGRLVWGLTEQGQILLGALSK